MMLVSAFTSELGIQLPIQALPLVSSNVGGGWRNFPTVFSFQPNNHSPIFCNMACDYCRRSSLECYSSSCYYGLSLMQFSAYRSAATDRPSYRDPFQCFLVSPSIDILLPVPCLSETNAAIQLQLLHRSDVESASIFTRLRPRAVGAGGSLHMSARALLRVSINPRPIVSSFLMHHLLRLVEWRVRP